MMFNNFDFKLTYLKQDISYLYYIIPHHWYSAQYLYITKYEKMVSMTVYLNICFDGNAYHIISVTCIILIKALRLLHITY